MMSALNSNKAIGRFEDLTESTKLIDELLPPKNHPYYKQALNAYRTYERCLKTFLTKENVIPKSSAPKAYAQMLLYKDTVDGFQLLYLITKKLNLNIGGVMMDFIASVDTLQICHAEWILDVYTCTLEIQNQIKKL